MRRSVLLAVVLAVLSSQAPAQREVASFKYGEMPPMYLRRLAVSPAGKFAAALLRGHGRGKGDVAEDHVRIWDIKPGKQLVLFQTGWHGAVSGSLFSFTPDGKQIVASTRQGLYVFDTKGRQLKAFEARVSPEVSALAADGKTAVCAAAGEVAAYDLKTGKELFAVKTKAVNIGLIALSPDGNLAAISDNIGAVHLIDLKARKELKPLPKDERRGVKGLAFSPDSKRLAVCEDAERYALYDLKSRRRTHRLNMKDHGVSLSPKGMAFTPDGKRLVAAGSGTGVGVYVWEWEAGKLLGDKTDRPNNQRGMALSADGKVLVTGFQEVKVYALDEDKKAKP